MAARYVNPDNVTAQGQYFYTGLLPGSYDTGGAGGGNVYGAGSGGSAGVGADRTGSDSSKSWAYQSNWNMNLGRTNWKNPNKRKPEGGVVDPPAPVEPGKRTPPDDDDSPVGPWGPTAGRKPEGGDSPLDRHKVTLKPTRDSDYYQKKEDRRAAGRQKTVDARLGRAIGTADRVRTPALGGEGGTKEFAELPQAVVNAGTEFPMESGGSIRADMEIMRHPKPAAVAASNASSQGMWGAFTSSSASRAHSRPRTF